MYVSVNNCTPSFTLIIHRNCTSGLNCSVISTQWHSQESQRCVFSELPDQQLRDLKFSAKSLDEAMPAVAMNLQRQEEMPFGMSLVNGILLLFKITNTTSFRAAGAVAVTVPACWWILSNAPDTSHGHGEHGGHGEEHGEEHKEESEEESKDEPEAEVEEKSDEAEKADDSEKSEESDSENEKKDTDTPETSDDEEESDEKNTKTSSDSKGDNKKKLESKKGTKAGESDSEDGSEVS